MQRDRWPRNEYLNNECHNIRAIFHLEDLITSEIHPVGGWAIVSTHCNWWIWGFILTHSLTAVWTLNQVFRVMCTRPSTGCLATPQMFPPPPLSDKRMKADSRYTTGECQAANRKWAHSYWYILHIVDRTRGLHFVELKLIFHRPFVHTVLNSKIIVTL